MGWSLKEELRYYWPIIVLLGVLLGGLLLGVAILIFGGW